MRWSDIVDKEEILGVLGLTTRSAAASRAWTAVGMFGIGLLAGLGAAFLYAPSSGAELRRELGRRFGWREELAPPGDVPGYDELAR